jgi:Ca-activated chloride channel family protein
LPDSGICAAGGLDFVEPYTLSEGAMKFTHLEMLLWLWMLPLLALMVWRGMRKRHDILKAFAVSRSHPAIIRHAQQNRRWLQGVLMLGTLLGLIVAMAGPQYGYKWQEIERKGIDIMIALDCSRSMLAEDIQPSRLDRAKREILDLLSLLQGDRAGLVAFAGSAFMQCPLTLDYNAFNLFLNVLSPDFMPVGGTDLAAAIETATAGFDPESQSEKAIILITDGEHTGDDPLNAAREAAKNGIKLFCIGVGSPEGFPIPDQAGGFKKDADGKIILTRIDENLLKKIAVLTSGTYVRSVAGDMDLDVIYHREIKDKMEAAKFKDGRKKVWEDRFQWFLGAALICLIMEMFLPFPRRLLLLMLLPMIILAADVPARAESESVGDDLAQGLEAYENKDYETALNAFIKTQLDDPERPEIYYNIGNTYYKLGKYDEARAHYQKVLTDDDLILKHKTLFNLGNAEFRAGRLEEAIHQYEAALKLKPNDEMARKNIEFVKKVQEAQQQSRPDEPPVPEEQQAQSRNGVQNDSDHQADDPPEDLQKSPNASGKDDENKETADSQKQPAKDDHKDKTSDEVSQSGKPPVQESGNAASSADQTTDTKDAGKVFQPMRFTENGEDKNESGQQATRMLNRLEDKPGRAMIPVYRKQQVEKDW